MRTAGTSVPDGRFVRHDVSDGRGQAPQVAWVAVLHCLHPTSLLRSVVVLSSALRGVAMFAPMLAAVADSITPTSPSPKAGLSSIRYVVRDRHVGAPSSHAGRFDLDLVCDSPIGSFEQVLHEEVGRLAGINDVQPVALRRSG
jgi:hypothetical protein